MRTRKLAVLMLSGVLVALLAGCPGDPEDPNPTTDGGGGGADASVDAGDEFDGGLPDGGTDGGDSGVGDGGQVTQEFNQFVRTEIETRTAETTLPVTIDDKTFVDSENPNFFEPGFFQ